MTRRKVAARARRMGIGALPLLAGLLMASGLLRIGDGTGQAIARELSALTQAEQADANGDEIAEILAGLKDRAAQLDLRAERLTERETALAAAETRIAEQLDRLEEAEQALDAKMRLADSAADDDLARLTSVYEAMKPRDAAALFEEMEPQFAAGFLGRMRADAAAAIMAGLAPETAYSVSVMLAGRHVTRDEG
ncbi:hypothetical protein OCGS_2097 [Oceaniovalibus guishaninsula JLT2003]|uniref:Magnesium transporter MgtE intracellular domain-containing protein n=1 Tax=Oceaniovalibus guishaninsula JLT2003 TaxID=1231392 RepID=K2H812_9RHOB|nr:hypothetical protein [Oceaniovalibus guishaninsula]EKE43763.1 hypothetical protein OCGS_2097 [Oceaniovalibus guishaninsula JLT2003]